MLIPLFFHMLPTKTKKVKPILSTIDLNFLFTLNPFDKKENKCYILLLPKGF